MIRAVLPFMLLAGAAAGETLRPAELPPTGYAGLQYVDSRGCLFARAGRAGEVLWIPRVSRDGVPDCSHPPSGRRVPVAGEEGGQPAPRAAVGNEDAVDEATAVGSYFVAVGSFGLAINADQAQARVEGLDYDVVRGRVESGTGPLITVFAGPFASAEAALAARQVLRSQGFSEATLVGP